MACRIEAAYKRRRRRPFEGDPPKDGSHIMTLATRCGVFIRESTLKDPANGAFLMRVLIKLRGKCPL